MKKINLQKFVNYKYEKNFFNYKIHSYEALEKFQNFRQTNAYRI
jgi:hypothetical protein